MTAEDVNALLDVADLTDSTTCLVMSDLLDEVGRDAEAEALRACQEGFLYGGKVYGVRERTQLNVRRASQLAYYHASRDDGERVAEQNLDVEVVVTHDRHEFLWVEGEDAPLAKNPDHYSWL